MKEVRTKAALKNTSISLISYLLIIIVGFISQRVFKDVLGTEYLGLHSLFSNIMTMLAVVELGFGTAIVSNMYRPVANDDKEEIISLIQFYKRVYRILAFIILAIGLCLLPFINLIVGNSELNVSYRIIFLFYLADTVSSYFITYKRSILYANQKTYYTNIIHTLCVATMNTLQVIFLITTHNYYIYLLLRVVFRLLENIIINLIANKLYPYIKAKEEYPLNEEIRSDILKKIKGLLFHRIGTFFVSGSDNIIISMLPNLGIKYVGLYSNYIMITNQLYSVVNQMFNSLTASVGNLLIEGNKEHSYSTFKKILMFNGWIYVYISIAFYYISFPFIELWMGSEFVLNKTVVFILTLNFFIQGMRSAYSTFKDAAGIFYEDRFIPLIESATNIVISITLGYFWGLAGVFIGTICSNLVLFIWSYPNFVYKKIFGISIKKYFGDIIKWLLFFLISFFAVFAICNNISISNTYLQLVINFVISFFIPNGILILFNYRTNEFKYYINLILKKIRV